MRDGSAAVIVSIDGIRVQNAQCSDVEGREQAGGMESGVVACTASCGIVAAGREVCIGITLLSPKLRAITAPHVIPFVLHATESRSRHDACHISVLPMRLAHGNRQKIPYTIAMESAAEAASGDAHHAASRARACLRANVEDDSQEARWAGACDSDEPDSHFNTPLLVDLSSPDIIEKLPDSVWVGGLGNVSLAWPANHLGPAGRAGVFKVLPISYAAYDDFIRPHSLPKVLVWGHLVSPRVCLLKVLVLGHLVSPRVCLLKVLVWGYLVSPRACLLKVLVWGHLVSPRACLHKVLVWGHLVSPRMCLLYTVSDPLSCSFLLVPVQGVRFRALSSRSHVCLPAPQTLRAAPRG